MFVKVKITTPKLVLSQCSPENKVLIPEIIIYRYFCYGNGSVILSHSSTLVSLQC